MAGTPPSRLQDTHTRNQHAPSLFQAGNALEGTACQNHNGTRNYLHISIVRQAICVFSYLDIQPRLITVCTIRSLIRDSVNRNMTLEKL